MTETLNFLGGFILGFVSSLVASIVMYYRMTETLNFFGGFILGFVSSLVASIVTYYITTYRPRKKDKEKIQELTSKIIRGIIGQGKIVFQTLLKEANIKRDFQNISFEDIKYIGPKIKLKNDAPPIIGFVTLTGANFAQYLCFFKDRTVNDLEKILIYILFLDSELIKRLNRVLHCNYFILCDEWLKNIHLVSDPDLTSFDEDLFEYYNAIRELETFVIDSKIIEK